MSGRELDEEELPVRGDDELELLDSGEELLEEPCGLGEELELLESGEELLELPGSGV